MHISILVSTIVEFFSASRLHLFVDGTVGAGGHSRAILEGHPELRRLYGVDRDPDALSLAADSLTPWREKVELIHGNFRAIGDSVPQGVDGILLDLGVSSMQLDRPERGFSFQHDGPLDMRMDPGGDLTAAKIVNTYPERELEKIFREYGELPKSRQAARAIVHARQKRALHTTYDLCEAVRPALGRQCRRMHPATLVFQALRICVNDELGALGEGIEKGLALLAPGGRFGVLSFHSLEDRIVKHTFRLASKEGSFRLLTKKPAQASMDEVRKNPRSRSARLRFIEKL